MLALYFALKSSGKDPLDSGDIFNEVFEKMYAGGDMGSPQELEAKGANFSLIHVDFMIGGPEMEIVAYTKTGETVKLFSAGNWTF